MCEADHSALTNLNRLELPCWVGFYSISTVCDKRESMLDKDFVCARLWFSFSLLCFWRSEASKRRKKPGVWETVRFHMYSSDSRISFSVPPNGSPAPSHSIEK